MEEKTNLETNTKKTGFNEHNIEIGNIELGEEQKAVYDELVSSSSNYYYMDCRENQVSLRYPTFDQIIYQ